MTHLSYKINAVASDRATGSGRNVVSGSTNHTFALDGVETVGEFAKALSRQQIPLSTSLAVAVDSRYKTPLHVAHSVIKREVLQTVDTGTVDITSAAKLEG